MLGLGNYLCGLIIPLTLWRIDIFCFLLGVMWSAFAMPCLTWLPTCQFTLKRILQVDLQQCMIAFRYTRCSGTLQLQIDFVMLSVQWLKQDIPRLKLHARIWPHCSMNIPWVAKKKKEKRKGEKRMTSQISMFFFAIERTGGAAAPTDKE
jgi:hypothetical protein